jgi:hypothetical protein
MRRLVLLFLTIAVFGAARADAVTLREIIELSKTGLSDEVLLALIDVERRAYPVDSDTLKMLKESGVSERVIIAMIRSGRSKPSVPEAPVAPTPQPEPHQPQVVVIDHDDRDDAPRVREVAVPVPVPVYMTVPVYVRTPRQGGGNRAHPVPAGVPASSIGLPHSRFGLSPPPPTPTSDPPYWRTYAPLPRRSDPPGWQKSPYLKP